MTKYQGHKNWNHWNVSLWINNDEGLYAMAMQCIRSNRTKASAASDMLERLTADCSERVHGGRMPIVATPDGAPYSASSVRAAMVGM